MVNDGAAFAATVALIVVATERLENEPRTTAEWLDGLRERRVNRASRRKPPLERWSNSHEVPEEQMRERKWLCKAQGF